MDIKVSALLGSRASEYEKSLVLRSSDVCDVSPVMPLEVQNQTNLLLSFGSGDEMAKGLWTGLLGGYGTLMGVFLAFDTLDSGNTLLTVQLFLISFAMFVIPFIWEIMSPLSPPIVLNRRTREIYFQHDSQIYHTPWDDVGAVAYEYQMVHQNVGAMNNAPLEVLMHRFRKPEDRIFVALGLPMGKTLELQQQVWAYLQAYMDRGPWLDEQGNSTDSPDFVNEHLAINRSNHRDSLKTDWARWRETREGAHFFLVLSSVFFYPMHALWDFTRNVAVKRSQHNWPDFVLERLKDDGPKTRLVDLETAGK